MKKVLLVCGSLPPIRCGVGYYTSHLVNELAKEKLDFALLSTLGVNEDLPATLYTVPNWKMRTIPRMLKQITKSGAEVIHIQYPAKGYRRQVGINLLPYALRLLRPRLKILITLHEYHQSRQVGRIRNRITIWPAHKILVSNQPDLSALKKLDDKVQIVPIGANFDQAKRNREFFDKLILSQKLDSAKETLLFFGYAFPSKRLEDLLDSLNEPQLRDFQLLIFPDIDDNSTYHQFLKEKISKLNSSSTRVGISGFLEGPEASAVMQESKYFVLPNSQPLTAKSGTAIAAIQNGLVLISRGSKRPMDTAPFEHLKNCYLLNEVSPAKIAESVEQMEKSPEQVKTILQGAKELGKYFSWDHIVKLHTQIYRKL